MLSPQDDLIGHLLPTPFDQIDNSDPAWMERLWYTGHPVPGGDVIFDIGPGYHPNRSSAATAAGLSSTAGGCRWTAGWASATTAGACAARCAPMKARRR